MVIKFETSKFLAHLNKSDNKSSKLENKSDKSDNKSKTNYKYIIKINELQQIIRFVNFQKQKLDENLKNSNSFELCSIEYIDFVDCFGELKEDLLDLIFSIDSYDTDFINNKLVFILENNFPKNNTNYILMKEIVKESGSYLAPKFVRYFI
jgi:hypothetical protein